jgi:hypothetical protein
MTNPPPAKTITGIGSDGKQYTVHGYKSTRRQNGQLLESKLIGITKTDEGEEVHCKSENPLVFWIPSTGVEIRCDETS